MFYVKKDLVNRVFGDLKVLKEEVKRPTSNHSYWLVRCECGKEFVIRGTLLTNNKQTCCYDCGRLKGGMTTHNLTHTRLFDIWQSMKARCYNKNSKFYYRYGGRGICICNEWKDDFKTFYDWSMQNGYNKGLTIDRINNDGNYEPNNCRWITQQEQANNKCINHLITYKGKTLTLAQWSRELGIEYYNILNRLTKYNWSVEKAFTTPVKHNPRKTT